MNTTALKEIVARVALNDDNVAYKQLFLHYHPKLVSFSYAITHCKESSEEVVSDVFLNIWNHHQTLLRIENFHLYLYVSIKNISLNYLTKQRRERSFSLDDVKTELKSLYFDPEQLMITSEMYRRICSAVNALPPKCRLIFKLVKEDNLRYKEVAELLHLSVKTVEAQMTIALRKLGASIALQQSLY
ncbi:MAG TPA: RNA polymerase sigma-70 factor [Flavisolibacter sp.]|jgi:RNA polymerase sigma-70 factor (ECF subfamily)